MEDLLWAKFPRCLLWVLFTNSTLHLGWFCCFSTQIWEVFHSPPSFTKSLIRFFCVYLLLLFFLFFRIWTFLDWVCPSKNIILTSFIRLNLIYWSGREETALIFSWLRLVFHYRGSTNINTSIHNVNGNQPRDEHRRMKTFVPMSQYKAGNQSSNYA